MDPTSVCNQALGELGAGFIASFTDGTSLSTLCGQIYPESRDEVLGLHPWNFALVFARLARSADTPAMTWQYQYPLPTDPYCLVVREVNHGPFIAWAIGLDALGHRVLFTNEGSVSIAYTARVEDLTIWSPLARQVLVKMLASKLAKPVTGQNSTTELKLKELTGLLGEARLRDAKEGAPQVLQQHGLLWAARRTTGFGGLRYPRSFTVGGS